MGGCFDCVQQGVDAIKAGEIGKLGLLSITTVHGWNYIVRSSSVHITHIVPMCYIPSSFPWIIAGNSKINKPKYICTYKNRWHLICLSKMGLFVQSFIKNENRWTKITISWYVLICSNIFNCRIRRRTIFELTDSYFV